MSDPRRPPPARSPDAELLSSNLCRGWLMAIMALAGLAFAGSFLAGSEDLIGRILRMGFSAVVFTLAMVGLILVDIRTELRLLTERRRQRLEAECRAHAGRREAERQARFADWEKRNRVWVDPDAMQITQEDVTAQRKADWHQWREIWRGQWARFWNGMRRRIARMLGEENEILIGLVFGTVKALCCLLPFWLLAAAAIVAWSVL